MDLTDVVVYVTTREEFNSILEFAVQKGYDTDSVMYDAVWTRPHTCLRFNENMWLTYSHKSWYESEGYNVVSYEGFVLANSANPFATEELSKGSLKDVVVEILSEEANTNPKESLGLSNIPMNLLSPIACAYGSIGKLNGKLKYGLSNYNGTKVIMSIYIDAVRRHLDAFMSGEECDPADNVPHMAAILANVDIILCARAADTLIDDRPLIKGYREEMTKLKELVPMLQELHKGKNPKHYYLDEEM